MEHERMDREAIASKTSAEIEQQIEETRSRLSDNIDTLGERLRPGNLAQSAVASAGEQARVTGSRLSNVIRQNPIPVAAIGLGVTWLVAQRRSGRSGRYRTRGPERRRASYPEQRPLPGTERPGERVSELGTEAKARVEELGTRAREQAQRVGTSFERMIDQNPLAVAAGAVALGVTLGLLIPQGRRESELIGSTGERLREQAGQTVERVTEAALSAVPDSPQGV